MHTTCCLTGMQLAIGAAIFLILALPASALAHCDTLDGPMVADARVALEKGNVDDLAKAIACHAESGIRERFQHALATRKHAQESVVAGRDYVEAYVTYVHYVEGIVNAVYAKAHHGEAEAPAHHQR